MREYELTVVYDLAVMETGGPEASIQQLTHHVEARGGSILRTDHWGRRRMAYPIGRAIDGDYIVSRVNLEPSSVEPLESALRIDERVYRHLIVRADELPVPAPPREQRPAAAEAPTPEPVAAGTADTTTAEPASGPALPPAEPVPAAEAIANAEAKTAEELAPEPAPEAAPPIEEPLRDTGPETSTSGFASAAAAENTGIDVEDLESHKATGPHAEQDSPTDETTA